MPVTWEELGRTKAGNQYTVPHLGTQLAGLKRDAWKEMERVKQELPQVSTLRKW